MCVIVDANQLAAFVCPNNEVGKILRQWLLKEGATVTGGRHAAEVSRNRAAAAYFAELRRSGKLIVYKKDAVDAKEAEVVGLSMLSSDDPHIVALAIVSGARVLFSDDEALCNDFKDRRILPSPRGKVLRYKRHARSLLRHHMKCPIR